MRSSPQAQKDRLLSGLVEARRAILESASPLPAAAQDQVFLGIWSVTDLLTHLIGWDFTNIQAVRDLLSGKLPSFYAYYDRDWKTYNARLVAQHKKDHFPDLLAAVEDSHQKLVGSLNSVPAEEFDKDRGVRFRGYKVTVARLLQVEIDDEKTHHRQIQEFAARVPAAH